MKLWKDMTPEEKGALLLAYHEGQEIEYRHSLSGEWLRCPQGIGPSWDYHAAYRIKPVREVRNCDAHYIDGCVWSGHEKEVDNMIISIALEDGHPDKSVPPIARWVE